VALMMDEHKIMLQRNLLYTALTRAQHLVFLVGSRGAIDIAVRTNKPHGRRSGLSHWLKKASTF
jgi:exodeoxyribonuclease V alpha subunit